MPAVPIYDRELHHLAFLPAFRIKAACPKKDAHHVERTVIVGALHPLMLAFIVDSVLAQPAPAVRIGIKHLIHRVTLSFPGSLTEVERFPLFRVIGEEGVAQHKIIVQPTVPTCGE